MRLLIIGGTRFLGRHLVDAALARGHTVTLFNRGRTNPDLFPGVERLLGDRGQDVSALAGRTWDAVVDMCGYLPRDVRLVANALTGAVGHYTFVSSISVYADLAAVVDEDSPVARLDDETVETVETITAEAITAETYGVLKALCEAEAAAAFPGQALVVRPGLIVGPHDPTDRFTYWVRRFGTGGEVLAPGRRERRVQFIDACDLAGWMLRLVERGETGVLNATGPAGGEDSVGQLTMADLLAWARDERATDAVFTWVDDDFLTAEGVAPYSDLPLWIPGQDDRVTIDRALAAGLAFRPLVETLRDTREWDAMRGGGDLRAGMSSEREGELLARWKGVGEGAT